ncbi:hypothetical protein K4039_02020 [Lyngbya sp. CCAP 1446/10]|uniref:hypothetical protein n=1 Tax=Microcoleaceae TaxID=1892252 RepID=UPI002238CDBA|nr:hypothetical protein [Lyngbya sp. CCAP 1446/10]MCW6048883.1 hypothetical protein [Lyngbya sp. CCAP 1446/10]
MSRNRLSAIGRVYAPINSLHPLQLQLWARTCPPALATTQTRLHSADSTSRIGIGRLSSAIGHFAILYFRFAITNYYRGNVKIKA